MIMIIYKVNDAKKKTNWCSVYTSLEIEIHAQGHKEIYVH